MLMSGDLGQSMYKTWSPEQRREEIEKLVIGYRNGLPVGILCSMSEAIAGDRESAREVLIELLTPEECTTAINGESASMKELLTSFLQ